MAQVVVAWGEHPFTQEIEAEGHRWQADEPQELGGQDQGPNPYQLLLSALGACTCITLQMYAGRKGWPLRQVRVELDHQRLHAQDCRDCETKEGYLSEGDYIRKWRKLWYRMGEAAMMQAWSGSPHGLTGYPIPGSAYSRSLAPWAWFWEPIKW